MPNLSIKFQRLIYCLLTFFFIGYTSASFSSNSLTKFTAAPGAPSINWLQSNWPSGGKIPLSWNLYWGVTGTSWQVVANGQTVFTSSTFTSTGPNTQSGSTDLTLKDGKIALVVKLCNASECASSAPVNIVVGADSEKKPTPPQVTPIGNIIQGNNLPIIWNMWWGEIGSGWEVWIDNKQVHTSKVFTKNEAHTQSGQVDLSTTTLSLANGAHNLIVKLCNGVNCGEGSQSFTTSGSTPTPVAPGKPVIAPIGDSTSKQVTLNWSRTTGAKGTSWYVTDNFKGATSTIFPSTSTFIEDTVAKQSGSAQLILDSGSHKLSLQLCNASSVCTVSNEVTVNITAPPAPAPGVPVLDAIQNSSNGLLNVKWQTSGAGGSYWEIWNGNVLVDKNTQFADSANKSGIKSLPVANGTYVVTIKLCNDSSTCSISNQRTATVSGAADKKTMFISYYPTWFAPYHNAFCDQGGRYYDYVSKTWLACTAGAVLPNNTISSSSLLAGGIPNYVTHVILAFAKTNQMRNYTGLSKTDGDLKAIGMDLTPSSASIKESIRVLKVNNPGTKVLLALGGASFNAFWKNVTQADIDGSAKLILDLGLDGLDIDYEVSGTDTATIDEYYNSIVWMRKAVDKANLTKTDGKAILTVPGWSTGADCTAQTQGASHPGCRPDKISYWGGNAGRERLVLEKRGAASMFDIVSIMSYDASYEHFDPVTAYNNYKQIVKPGTPIALGIQPSPDEGWGGAKTFVTDRGINNDCVGNTVLEDQYGVKTPGTFSVQRLADVVKKTPGDGMMMWSLFASRPSVMCGTAKLSTVTELGQGVSQYLGVGTDRTKLIDYNTAINYGRQ